jgi:hypothetical protein
VITAKRGAGFPAPGILLMHGIPITDAPILRAGKINPLPTALGGSPYKYLRKI